MRIKENGALQFHYGTERQLLSHLQKKLESCSNPNPAYILKEIDTFCMDNHWMMHVGNEKSGIISSALMKATKYSESEDRLVLLEMGTYCGYSSILISTLIQKINVDCKFLIYSLEINEEFGDVAEKIVELAGLQNNVKILVQNSIDEGILKVKSLLQNEGISFLFIDHDKRLYLQDLEKCIKNDILNDNAVIAADNVIMAEINDYLHFVRTRTDLFSESEIFMSFIEYTEPERRLLGDEAMKDGVEVSVFRGMHPMNEEDNNIHVESGAIGGGAYDNDGWDCFADSGDETEDITDATGDNKQSSNDTLNDSSHESGFEVKTSQYQQTTALHPSQLNALYIECVKLTTTKDTNLPSSGSITTTSSIMKELPTYLTIVYDSDNTTVADTLQSKFRPKNKWNVTMLHMNDLINTFSHSTTGDNEHTHKSSCDICIVLASEGIQPSVYTWINLNSVVPGGLVLIAIQKSDNCSTKLINNFRKHFPKLYWPYDVQIAPIAHYSSGTTTALKFDSFNSLPNSHSHLFTSFSDISSSTSITSSFVLKLKKRSVLVNPIAHRDASFHLQSPILQAKQLRHEQHLCDAITIVRSIAERREDCLSAVSHAQAVHSLQTHGVVIIRGMYSPEAVMEWRDAALHDFNNVKKKLMCGYDIDLLHPESKPAYRNFKEFAMREAYRCDIRHTPQLVAMRNKGADCNTNSNNNNNNNDSSSIHEQKHINTRHQCVVSILQDLMQPDGGLLNQGNYGKWNFEMGGPGSRQKLVSGDIGTILSWPGCINQKLHADIPHLYNTIDTPPHILHAFMPALTSKQSEQWKVGQTAFVIGSHKLATCARMTATTTTSDDDDDDDDDDVSTEELVESTIRPHVEAGDLIIFDCRILHFGLGNSSAAAGSDVATDGVIRPILYVNWHQPWFEDRKNWENESLFAK